MQWLIDFRQIKEKGGKGIKVSLANKETVSMSVFVCNIECKTFEAVGDTPAVVLTVDSCLCERLNIYQCKMGAISLTQYWAC